MGVVLDNERKFRLNLLRKFKILENMDISIGAERALKSSFCLQYLKSHNQNETEVSFEISLAKAALNEARLFGQKEAIDVLEQFSELGENEVARAIVTGDVQELNFSKFSIYDKYAFQNPVVEKSSFQKQQCYKEIFSKYRISVPLNKHGINRLLALVGGEMTGEFSTFDQLTEFIWQFAKSTWPLFDIKILQIPFRYFDFAQKIETSSMRMDLEHMATYGLDRLLARMIILRFVAGRYDGDISSILEKSLSMAGLSTHKSHIIQSYLSGSPFHEIKIENKNNPIENAIFHSIYISGATNAFDFLTRVRETFEYDSSIIRLINWDIHYDNIEGTADYLTASNIFMAALFSEDNMLSHSPEIKNLYVPSGATTDLFNYAKYCREEKKLSAHQFFSSFQSLAPVCQKLIFKFLLSPGVLDGLANIFPSEKRLVIEVERDDAINALSLKLDCLSFLKKKPNLGVRDLRSIETQTRQRLRQVKYETDTGSGRIRLNFEKLIDEMENFLWDDVSIESIHNNSLGQIRNERLRSFVNRQRLEKFSQNSTEFFCFGNRFAFDYLISNLRHNFLRFRIERAIDVSFHNKRSDDAGLLKIILNEYLDGYCQNWLTISRSRSFYNNLQNDILNLDISANHRDPERFFEVAAEVTKLAVDSFENLLSACRQAWSTSFRNDVSGAILSTLDECDSRDDSGLRDTLIGELARAFEDCESWLTINENPMNAEFGLKDLFLFEGTNFSSAKTRRKPFVVQCYRGDGTMARSTPTSDDFLIPGNSFDAMVLLVQNLLENAYKYSGLSVSNTQIDVSIFKLDDEQIIVEFRNNFNPDKSKEIRQLLFNFNKHLELSQEELKNSELEKIQAPSDTGGSGLKRIYFELQNAFGDDFYLGVDDREIKKGFFLVNCQFPLN